MTTISLSLGPPALVRLHDVLICLSKFSDTVAIEAEYDLVSTGSRDRNLRIVPNEIQLRLSALNSTKTAFASFACAREVFFEAYSFTVRRSAAGNGGDRFYCQILIKVSKVTIDGWNLI